VRPHQKGMRSGRRVSRRLPREARCCARVCLLFCVFPRVAFQVLQYRVLTVSCNAEPAVLRRLSDGRWHSRVYHIRRIFALQTCASGEHEKRGAVKATHICHFEVCDFARDLLQRGMIRVSPRKFYSECTKSCPRGVGLNANCLPRRAGVKFRDYSTYVCIRAPPKVVDAAPTRLASFRGHSQVEREPLRP